MIIRISHAFCGWGRDVVVLNSDDNEWDFVQSNMFFFFGIDEVALLIPIFLLVCLSFFCDLRSVSYHVDKLGQQDHVVDIRVVRILVSDAIIVHHSLICLAIYWSVIICSYALAFIFFSCRPALHIVKQSTAKCYESRIACP